MIIDWGIKQFYDVEIDESQILYYESVCDWSWADVLIVFQDKGKYFIVDDFDSWEPQEVTQEWALQEMLDFEVMKNEMYGYPNW